MPDGSFAPNATARFNRKRVAIIVAATELLNQNGVRGMTLAEVADRVGLITTSVTYYFKRKEDLAAACFLAGVRRLAALTAEASAEDTASARLRRLIELYLALRARVDAGEEPPMPVFGDIRALSPPAQRPIATAYGDLFRQVRRLLAAPDAGVLSRGQATARAQIVLEQLHWLEAWLPRYKRATPARVGERLHDILTHGLAAPGASWRPAPLPAMTAGEPSPREAFLQAATRLINERGYHGASVDAISAALGVTKGSFYHHHSAKDDVVAACFERSFETVRRAQAAAQVLPAGQWTRLTSAAAALVERQFSAAGPLLRTTALAAIPQGIREEMLAGSIRLSDGFAAMIADGVAEGSLRGVDPFVAAQMLNATLNAAADLPVLLRGVSASTAVDFYARPFFTGLTAA